MAKMAYLNKLFNYNITDTTFRESDRDISLDWIAGLLIIHMILTHIDQWSEVYTMDRVLFFFMAWFFYKSGMFHKVKEQKTIVKEAFQRLLKPMIIFSIIGQLVITILLILSRDTNPLHYISFIKPLFIYGAVPANLALWFLGTLFIDKVFFNWLCLKKINTKLIILISIASGYIFYLIGKELFLPDYLGNICFGMTFYALGYWLKRFRLSLPNLILLGIGISILYYYCFSVIAARNNTLIVGYYPIAILLELGAILFINNIIRFTPPIILKITGLHHIGKQSMAYYVTHWIVIIICDFVCLKILDIERGYQYRWILISANIVLLPFFSWLLYRYFRTWIGNKSKNLLVSLSTN